MKNLHTPLPSILSLLLLLWSVVPLSAQTIIEVTEPGTLRSKLEVTSSLTDLTISGSLNADDFGALRETAGIERLDLSDVEIVAGGSYEGNPYMSEEVETLPETMPGYFLFDGELAKSLTALTLPNSVTRLDTRCLQNGANLTEIYLPSDLTYIGELAFGYCESLETIELPEGVDTLVGATFDGCTMLDDVMIPESVVYMGGSTFNGCSSLTSVTLPTTLREIPFATFKGCTSLEGVDLPEMLSKIGSFAFEGCIALEEIYLPPLLRTIEHDAFVGCEALSTVSIQSMALESIGDQAFMNCTALEEMIIPAGVTRIGGSAFSGCQSLYSLILPAKLQVIMGGAFAHTAITELIIPNGCQEILYGAFAHCKELELVTLPRSLQKMSDKAFGGCDALHTIIATNPTPIVSGNNEDLAGLIDLVAMSDLTLFVPEGSRSAYTATELWEDFANVSEMRSLLAEVSPERSLEDILAMIESPELYSSVKLTGDISYEDLEALTQLPLMQELDLGEISYSADDDILEGFGFNIYPLLRKLVYPKTLSAIPAGSCMEVMLLEEVVLPEALTEIQEEAFMYCSALRNIVLPPTVVTLGESAFHGCASLKEILLPEIIELIPDFGFFDCVSLEEIHFPKKVADIGEQAFVNNSHIKHIRLGASVKEIKSMAFFACEALETITSLSAEPPYMTEDVFLPEQYKTVTIVVASEEIKEAYQVAEGWSEFEHYLVDPSIILQTQQPREDTPIIIYGSVGSLHLELASECLISIYTPTGILRYSNNLAGGIHQLPLSSGLYIITANEASYKVYVP